MRTARENHRVEGSIPPKLQDNSTEVTSASGSWEKMNVAKVAAVFLMLLCLLLLAALIVLGVQSIQDKTSCSMKVSQLWMNGVNLTAERYELLESYSKVSHINHNLGQKINRLQINRHQLQANNSRLMREREDYEKQVLEKARCSGNWTQFGNTCYFFFKSLKTWNESKYDCQSRGAQLAIISSAEEQKFIAIFIDTAWIGLTDEETEGAWKWVDGTSPKATYWRVGQPDNHLEKEHCAENNGNNWNDLPCGDKNHWICNKVLQ